MCLGYKGYVIKEYFANYFLHSSDVTFDLRGRGMEVHDGEVEPWRVTLLDTGPDTQTGGRVKRVAGHLDGETFLLTYGDGLADIDISALLAFHRAHGRLATVTAVQPLGRFGALQLDEKQQRVTSFDEKPAGDGAWVNGGFFVLEPGVLDYIAGDETYFEHEPLERLAPTASSWPTVTAGSGSPWTCCATRTCSNSSGSRAGRPGECGERGAQRRWRRASGPVRRRLCRAPGARHRSHRLQGLLAVRLASRPRGDRGRLRPGAADLSQPLRAARPGRRGRARHR